MWQPPGGGAGVCEFCLGLGTSDSDLDGQATQFGRSERSCPVAQMDASSDEEVLVSSNHGRRVVPRTEHEFPTSGSASSQALAWVQHVSREVENGNDEDQLRIGQHRNVCARVGDSHDRAEPQEPSVSGSLVRGNFARGPAVDVQNRFRKTVRFLWGHATLEIGI